MSYFPPFLPFVLFLSSTSLPSFPSKLFLSSTSFLSLLNCSCLLPRFLPFSDHPCLLPTSFPSFSSFPISLSSYLPILLPSWYKSVPFPFLLLTLITSTLTAKTWGRNAGKLSIRCSLSKGLWDAFILPHHQDLLHVTRCHCYDSHTYSSSLLPHNTAMPAGHSYSFTAPRLVINQYKQTIHSPTQHSTV